MRVCARTRAQPELCSLPATYGPRIYMVLRSTAAPVAASNADLRTGAAQAGGKRRINRAQAEIKVGFSSRLGEASCSEPFPPEEEKRVVKGCKGCVRSESNWRVYFLSPLPS